MKLAAHAFTFFFFHVRTCCMCSTDFVHLSHSKSKTLPDHPMDSPWRLVACNGKASDFDSKSEHVILLYCLMFNLLEREGDIFTLNILYFSYLSISFPFFFFPFKKPKV